MGGQTDRETERRTAWVTELTNIDWPYWRTYWLSDCPLKEVNDCLTDGADRRETDWLAWLTDWLSDWPYWWTDGLMDYLIGHLSKWMIAWLMERTDGRETDGLTDLTNWLNERLTLLMDYLIGQLAEWLTDQINDSWQLADRLTQKKAW